MFGYGGLEKGWDAGERRRGGVQLNQQGSSKEKQWL